MAAIIPAIPSVANGILTLMMLRRVVSHMHVAEGTKKKGAEKRQHVLDELKKELGDEYPSIEPVLHVVIDTLVLMSRSNIDISRINAPPGCKHFCSLS